METKALVAQIEEELIAARRHIHAHPELSNLEFETTKYIRAKLEEFGIEIAEIGLKTGVVGVIRGGKPGKNLAFRADCDALPMQEKTGLPFSSVNEGACHSCGHDIHTACLLYTAKILQDIREELSGNILLLFQPAEEGGAGAQQLVDCRFYDVLMPDMLIGLHTAPKYPVGTIGVKYGVSGASSDSYRIVVTGKSGHGAHPENFVDPIMTSAYLLTQLQTIVARENHPCRPAVLTVGSIHGGTAPNAVPAQVEMQGTLRSLDNAQRMKMKESMKRIVENCCEAMRCKGELIWKGAGVPVHVGDAVAVDAVVKAAKQVLGPEAINYGEDPSLGSEDFAVLHPAYGPGCQFGIGTANEDPRSRIGIHNPENIFDERCLPTGVAVMVQVARDYLA